MNKEAEETKEMVQTEETSPVVMAQALLKKGIKPEDVEKMLTLQERYEATQANKTYCREMAVVQQGIPIVKKTLKNSQTGSMYAGLDDIIRDTKAIYTAQGFSVTFYEGDSPLEGHIRIFADVRHSAGHKETYHYDMPLDGVGIKGNVNMTKIHGKGSSTSYGRRYLMCMIWNIPTGDDDDGNAAGGKVEYIGDSELSQIKDYTDNFKVFDEAVFLEYIKVESFEKIEKKDFNKVIIALETKKKQEDKK